MRLVTVTDDDRLGAGDCRFEIGRFERPLMFVLSLCGRLCC